ncbi:hypothetical protein CPAST_c15280 [Clostridium pasteurianum DSM 525 = ATCC 6013]|uniref:Uncharacterized protein n=1 Tax=Clostridium pasteurianum DSM 525 = ATCC 6013 TaxID=1262449 RepID=A0A0H3J6P3_CLOPA|nr:hypothetical protein [Clostridium pasteurianum]AJA47603.1 hypothetical protein CPAST_c15280 [Clostridium pasteurianum DSM 525 = ATCC 6013]AJA51591.1 hypothetical protein CLPA_c15280 [Clostridium pasteurianum DSM 525 = ATCC 6013]AOZ74915.1 hypothetical protein AQ983_07385 [Clostridium pasteurianum DSM 525 = ATCC 6013]AOZ78710.1 hypothetical protein AQ984_07375 [Clostridium pasteurianum]ELP58057.1 hypothetical protein F502_16460 [Clostridium pasteurianum DSM 525 = ATCC 6013]
MKKKIKFIPIILIFLIGINLSVNEFNFFGQFKNDFISNTSIENTKNIALLAPEGNSNTNSSSTEEKKNNDTSNTSDNSDNGNVTKPSDNSEPANNSNESKNNSGSNVEEPAEPEKPTTPTEPSTPSEVVVPAEPTIPKQSQQQSTPSANTEAASNSSVKSSSGSSTGNYSSKRRTNNSSSISNSSISTNSNNNSTSTSTSKLSNGDTTQNEAVINAAEQNTAPVNQQNNVQEAAKEENKVVIDASLSKGNIILEEKSNGIKLSSDNKDLKEIYYVLSNSKSTNNNEKWIKYSSPLKFDKKGTWYIHYKAVDKNGKESYGSFGPYNVSYKYETLEAGAEDNSLKKKIIGFSMIVVIIILAAIYIIKTNRSPYSKLNDENSYKSRKKFNFKFK